MKFTGSINAICITFLQSHRKCMPCNDSSVNIAMHVSPVNSVPAGQTFPLYLWMGIAYAVFRISGNCRWMPTWHCICLIKAKAMHDRWQWSHWHSVPTKFDNRSIACATRSILLIMVHLKIMLMLCIECKQLELTVPYLHFSYTRQCWKLKEVFFYFHL